MNSSICSMAVAVAFLSGPAVASEASTFVDGLWRGGITLNPDNPSRDECWASTGYDDGTTLMLAARRNFDWYLRLSNPNWRLPDSLTYQMVALVDFYPRLDVKAEVMRQDLLEIAIRGHNPLLGLIENGHTMTLTANLFNGSYNLEGSAKIIERVRFCISDQLASGRTGSEQPQQVKPVTKADAFLSDEAARRDRADGGHRPRS